MRFKEGDVVVIVKVDEITSEHTWVEELLDSDNAVNDAVVATFDGRTFVTDDV